MALQEISMSELIVSVSGVRGIVGELLGAQGSREQVELCALSIMHQILAIGFRGGRKPPFLGAGAFTEEEIEALIEHTYQFSLGGVKAIGRRNGLEATAGVKGAGR